MSNGEQRGGRAAIDLLLQILEMPKAVITAAAIDILGVHRTAPLVSAGLLKQSGIEAVSVSTSNHDDALVTLTWSAEDGRYGYFSPTAGWITVPNDEIAVYRVDTAAFLARLMLKCDVLSCGAAAALVPEHLWEIGDVRLGRRTQRVSIWFARRLDDPMVWSQVKEMARVRPVAQVRLLLTSSATSRLPKEVVPKHLVINVGDVIDFITGMSVHPEILAARLDGKPMPEVDSSIFLSPDGRRLIINGTNPIEFKSDNQIAIIRMLVEGFKKGKRYRAQELLTAGRSSSTSLHCAFGRKKWEMLEPCLKSHDGLWGFEV